MVVGIFLGCSRSLCYKLSTAVNLAQKATYNSWQIAQRLESNFVRHYHSKMASKTFCFQEYDAVGVDLDHTICKYKLDAMFPLIYSCLAKVLVNDHGYSKDLLEPFEKDKDFLTKGLILDTSNGNFLKLSGDGFILRATHGTKPLTEEELITYYGKDRQWEHFKPLKETLTQTAHARYFENYFDMPAAVLLARLIDLKDKEAGKRLNKYSLSAHMTDALNKVFDRQHFKDGTGGYFSECRANPSTYFQPCSDITKQWFKNLRSSGKTLFLQTSSNVDYAKLLLEHILGPEWADYFDICIMYARKPGFFMETKPADRPFYTLKEDKEDNPTMQIGDDKMYSQGNIISFTEYLQKKTGKEKPKVAYMGDSIRSDVWPTNVHAGWASVLILEEMEAEGLTQRGQGSDDDDEPPAKLTKLQHPSIKEQEFLLSSVWGSFFVDNKPKSPSTDETNGKKTQQCDSLWGHFVKTYSTIAVPTVEHVSVFPLDHEFKTFTYDDSGTAGYYPSMPSPYQQ